MDRLEGQGNTGLLQRIVASQPAFHLIYLVFYFIPWLSIRPGNTDILVALLAISAFIPLHFMGHGNKSSKSLLAIVGTLLLCVITSAFVAGSGVFYIYVLAMAAYQRPLSFSAIIVAIATAIYLGATAFFEQPWIFAGFNLFMGLIVWFGCVIDAATRQRQADMVRFHELDRQQASIEERERIARDLHDLLGHTLTMVALKADIAARMIETDTENARLEIRSIGSSARNALADVRAAVSDMTATTVAIEIANALRACESAGITFSIRGEIPEILNTHQQAMAMMIREGMTNIVRHSNAQNVELSFDADTAYCCLNITDDGIGFKALAGRGLTGLQERFSRLGGEFRYFSDNGAQLSGRLPIRPVATA